MKSMPRPLAESLYDFAATAFPDGGFFIEAGANDGIAHSTTIGLDKSLWSGLLVEPSPPAFERLVENRKDAILANVALVGDDSVSTLRGTFADGSLMGTADPKLVRRDAAKPRTLFAKVMKKFRRLARIRPKIKMRSVQATTLNKLVAEHGIRGVDLFVLDVEGFELEVLRGFSFSPKPRVVVIETRPDSFFEISNLMLKQGYFLCANFSNFTKEIFPAFSGDHQDYVWVASDEKRIIQAVKDAIVYEPHGASPQ